MKREEVIEIAKKYWSCIEFNGGDILAQAFASEVERRTIEKCAQICDVKESSLKNNGYSYESRIACSIGKEIRALANQQEKQT